jgi:biopolymer transport protein ExbD
MAEIISRNKGHKKPMPRVDLTPMVDLGFLLITFFIVTTSMTKPVALALNNPADGTSEAAESKTLTLVLVNNDKIVYYYGNDSLHCNTCNYASTKGLRDVITQKQLLVEKKFGKKSETIILIKPSTQSNYKNIVSTLDEMLICNITRYMILNTTAYEEGLVK